MRAAATAAVALAAALALCGCATSYPAGPSAVQVEAERQRVLDLTWQNLGLDGERPTPAVTPLSAGEEWTTEFYRCLTHAGVTSQGWAYSSATGFDFDYGYGYDDATLRQFYTCAASLPLVRFAAAELRTPEQVDYLYSYFQEWLIPCLGAHGYEVANVPTKQRFSDDGAYWTPYEQITLKDLVYSDNLVQNCGLVPGSDHTNEYVTSLQQSADELADR